MISLYRDPEGENVFSKTSPSSLSHTSVNNKEALKDNERVIETLRNRVKELESSLQQDGKLTFDGDSQSVERKGSVAKVTFSELNTLVINNDHSHTSSANGSINNIVDDLQEVGSSTV